ncbi:uncharacterized protein LOC111060226 isoform X7 [Nilaparvata lugens]|uniref:uncharacterized protein LOC111060226 isoform X7 n=1 Tax=Nilaparvata lugens TaxID=108931 RepID=UPI00193CEC33|nr:uncharacterized protein LOC111060226 isoform X7 [Nilaparvata lugens]
MAATESSTPVEAELSELTTESQTLSPDTADTVRSKRGDGNDKREAKVGEKEPRSLFSFEFVDEEDEETQRKRRSGSPGSDFLNLFASKLKPKGGLLSVSSPDRAYPGPISPEWQEPLHYGEKSFNLWGFKKAIFGAIVQAVKAITGGVLALKGQLLKVKGHIVEAKGKVLQTKGEAISQFGKHVATKALLNPAPHYGPSSAGSGPGISAPGGPSGYAGPSPISASAPVYGPPIHSAGIPSVYGPPSHSAGLGALPPSGGGGSYGPPPPGHFGGAPAAPSPFLSSYDRPQGPPAQGYGAPPPPGNEYLPAAGYGKPLQEYGQPYKRDSNAFKRRRQDSRTKKEASGDRMKKEISLDETRKGTQEGENTTVQTTSQKA